MKQIDRSQREEGWRGSGGHSKRLTKEPICICNSVVKAWGGAGAGQRGA